jgi:hypothetical protein
MQKVEESASVISAADESAVSKSCSITVDVRVSHSEEVQLAMIVLYPVLYTTPQMSLHL